MNLRKFAHLGTTDLFLLVETQEYLRTLLQKPVPDSLLQESWDVFYDVYNHLIRRFIIARGVRGSDVDDCVQEVWTEVATRLADFRHPHDHAGLRAWLYTVVRGKSANLIRQKMKQRVVHVDDQTAARIVPLGAFACLLP